MEGASATALGAARAGSSLTVAGAEVFAVANPAPRDGGPVWLFVRLDTDAGISGYGEIFTSSLFTRPLTTARIVGDFLTPPERVDGREFWTDQAAVRARAREFTDQGFTALKIDPLPLLTGLGRQAGQYVPVMPSLDALDQAESVVAAIREAVGSRADIIIGSHGQFTVAGAIRFARQLERYQPMWFEEPVPPERPGEMARVARATSIPVAAGERLTSKWQFAALARAAAAAIFNFDVTQVGGLTEGKKIAALAEAGFLQVTPHVFGGPLAAAASCQLALTLPNLLIMEGNGTYGGAYAELLDTPLSWAAGYLIPPDRPGIGHDLDERVARRWAVTEDDAFQYAQHLTRP